MTVGPDGALYIADFYNAIIGHYEVPLDHEKRDRTRGRIWRVIYKDPPAPSPDLTQLDTEQLIQTLNTDNESLRVLVNHQLVDNWETKDERLILDHYYQAAPNARAHMLWVLESQNKLTGAKLESAMNDESTVVQIHAQKILSERASWGAVEEDWALLGLGAENAFVRRAAAEGMRLHPDAVFLNPLLNAWKNADEEDTHLIHVIRMALREQLVHANGWSEGRSPNNRLLDIAAATETAEAAKFVLLKSSPHHEAFKHSLEVNLSLLSEKEIEGLIDRLAKTPFSEENNITLLEAFIHGLSTEPSPKLRVWALKSTSRALENVQTLEGPVIELAIRIAAFLELEELHDPLLALAEEGNLAACEAILRTCDKISPTDLRSLVGARYSSIRHGIHFG